MMKKNKLIRGIPGFVCFILVLPMVIYTVMSSTIDEYSNNVFKIVSTILFVLGLVAILSIIALNIIIAKKRKIIYSTVVKKEKKYGQGKKMLEDLLKIPQNRINIVSTYLHIAYVEMRAMNLDAAIKSFRDLKEINIDYKVGLSFSIMPSYYLILIYYFLEKEKEMRNEIEYFKKLNINLKTNIYSDLLKNINSLERKDFLNLITRLKVQEENPFIKVVVEKLERKM